MRTRLTSVLTIAVRAPRATLAALAVLTMVLGAAAGGLRVDSAIETLLPIDDPERRYYEEVRATFGSEEVTVVGVFADDVFAPATLATIDRLTRRLEALDGVREVLSLTTVKGVEASDVGLRIGPVVRTLPTTAAAAAALRAQILATPIYRGNVVARDGRAAAITVVYEPMTPAEFLARDLEGQIRAVLAREDGPEELAVTGIPTLKAVGAHLMERDIAIFTPVGVAVAGLVLLLAFRTARGVLVPLATVLAALAWTMGLMALAGGAINMGTLVLPPLLLTIGLAYAIHVVAHYYQEVQPERTAREVTTAAVRDVGLPVVICALTTLVGFTPFVWSPIPAIADFGRFALLGITATLVAALTIPPALLALLPVRGSAALREGSDGLLERWLDRLGGVAVLRPRRTLALAVAVCLLGAWGVTQLRIETDYVAFFPPASPVRVENARIGGALAGTQPLYVVVEGARPQAATRLEVLAAIADLQRFLAAEPGVDTTLSLVDYLGLVRNALAAPAPGTAPTGEAAAPPALPGTQDEVDQLLTLIAPRDVRAVVAADGARANVVVRTRLSGSAEVAEFVRRVEAFAATRLPRDVTAHVTGTVVLLNRSADALARGQIASLWQVMAALLVMMAILFLSVRVGVLALVPNVVPVLLLFGLMGWTGVSLNVSTSMIATIAIGLAIDDTIHLLSAFNEQLRRTGSQAQAVLRVMRVVGRAVTFTSVALAGGFLVVCLSGFRPVQYFGVLSAVTVTLALLADLMVTPALLTTTKIITVWDLLFLRLGDQPHREIPLFEGLRPFQAKIVVLMGELASAPRGALIAQQGEMRGELYVLLSGAAEVRREPEGRLLRTLGRGDVVGEMGFIRHRPRSADVVVVEDAEYLVLHESFLRRLRRRYPRIAATVFLNLSRILSDRLESTTDLLGERPVKQTLAG